MQKFSRRGFMKFFGIASVAALVPAIATAEQKKKKGGAAAAGGDLPLVTPGAGMAASVNYVHAHADMKKAELKTVRSGVAFDKQFCENCMLYSKHGTQGGEEVGKCTLFQGQVVKAKGWCNSWAKKA